MNVKHFLLFISIVFFFGCGEQKTPEPQPTEEWNTYLSKDGLAANEVNVVFVDSDNNKWFGTEFGISKKEPAGWTSYISNNGNLWNYIVDMDVEPTTNTVWFSTLAGASSLDSQGNWNYISYGDGIAFNKVYGVAFDENNTWFATQRGVSLLKNGEWTTFTENDGLAADWVTDVEVGNNGIAWFTTNQGGVSSVKLLTP